MEQQKSTPIDRDALKGTRTEQNLHTALSGESQAYLRYKWFEKKAKADGYVDVANLFATTAGNEMEHAEIWFRYLGGYSATPTNLKTAAGGEHFEWESMYAQFAKEAREEGFTALASLFERVAAIEKQHEQNYLRALGEVESGRVFEDSDPNCRWICLNCGHVLQGKKPPALCPVCQHPQGYFTRESGK